VTTAKGGYAIWWLRAGALAFALAYVLLPYSLTGYVPIWLPFFCVLAVEAQFFLSGLRSDPRPAGSRLGRGPQEHDLFELSEWFELDLPQGGSLRVGAGELTAAEVAGWADIHAEELAELAPGNYEVGPLRLDAGAEAIPRLVPAAAPQTRRRPRWSRHVVAAAVLVLLTTLLFLVPWRPGNWQRLSESNRASAEALYSQIATTIAGHPSRVGCDTAGHHVGVTQDADGVAIVGGRRAWLTPSICYTLYQLQTHRIRPDSAAAGRAIAVLAHEAWHLHGEGSEALANCYGFQSGVAVGVRLGLSEHRARQLMREQLATSLSDYSNNPAYLVPSGCHNDGTYDLRKGDAAFP